MREVKEEIGVELSSNSRSLLFSEVREHSHDIRDIWLFEYNGSVSLEKATTDEVAQVKWMNKEQIKKLFEEGKLVDTLKYFFSEAYRF